MSEKLYRHVLVPTDLQPRSRAAYRLARAIALGSGAKVSLMHVFPNAEPSDEYTGLDAIRLMHRAAERWKPRGDSPETQQALAKHRQGLLAEFDPEAAGAVQPHTEFRWGDLLAEVAQFATAERVDLIVLVDSLSFIGLGPRLSERIARATAAEVVALSPTG